MSQVTRIEPLASVTSASKILKPGRRVDRRPQLETRPAIDAVWPGLQRRDRLKAAAIFVADGKAVQQIFDGEETGVLEIGGAARTDALEELQGRREQLGGHVHCTID